MFNRIKRFITPKPDSPLRKYFREPALRTLTRESVARGVAIGIFTAVLPIMPFQMLLAIALSIVFRANLLVAIALSWINNPITIIPLVYFTSAVGQFVLNDSESPMQKMIKQFEWKLGLTDQSYFTSWVEQFGKDYFVGLPIVAIGLAILSYFLVDTSWYVYQLFKNRKK